MPWLNYGIGKLVNPKFFQGIQLHLSRSFCWRASQYSTSSIISNRWIDEQQEGYEAMYRTRFLNYESLQRRGINQYQRQIQKIFNNLSSKKHILARIQTGIETRKLA